MRFPRSVRFHLALVLGAAPAVLPASASAATSGHHAGYSLTFRGGRAIVTLPTPAQRLVPVEVACGRAGKEESVVAIAPLASGPLTLSAPSASPTSSRCIIRRNHHTVATIHLRPT
jgi:hypothetical protein